MLHEPVSPVRGIVVHLPAFAEEMNRCRRMVAVQARELARIGYAVLLIDLLGCGDSSGESGDASWSDWLADAELAIGWMRSRWEAPLWLWGLRAGCLLAAEVAARHANASLLLWQPPATGRSVLQSFLRLKAAGLLAAGDGGGKRVVDELRQQLAEGRPIEVAGYVISADLALGLERAVLDPGEGGGRPAAWLEITARDNPALLPASLPVLQRLTQRGWSVRTEAVKGPSFWQTTETEVAPQLVAASLQSLRHVD